MRKLAVMGMCVGAMLALGAVAVANAPAEQPEYRFCQKAKRDHEGHFIGLYNDGLCTEVAPEKDGKYEEVVFAELKEKKVKTVAGPSKLVSYEGEDIVECESSRSLGKVTGPREVGKVVVRYFGCKRLGLPCHSAGARRSNEIATSPLRGELGYIEETGPVVGELLEPESSIYSAEFSCGEGAPTIRMKGAVIGEASGNVNAFSDAAHQYFRQTSGLQQYMQFEGGEEETLLTEFEAGAGWEPLGGVRSGLEMSAKVKGVAAAIMACGEGEAVCKPAEFTSEAAQLEPGKGTSVQRFELGKISFRCERSTFKPEITEGVLSTDPAYESCKAYLIGEEYAGMARVTNSNCVYRYEAEKMERNEEPSFRGAMNVWTAFGKPECKLQVEITTGMKEGCSIAVEGEVASVNYRNIRFPPSGLEIKHNNVLTLQYAKNKKCPLYPNEGEYGSYVGTVVLPGVTVK